MQNDSIPDNNGTLSITKAILIGQLVINLPVLVIMLAFAWLGLVLLSKSWWILFICGFLIAWLWWAVAVPRWRNWAVQKGAPADKLHQAAVASGLEWPKGFIFEKTEIKVKK